MRYIVERRIFLENTGVVFKKPTKESLMECAKLMSTHLKTVDVEESPESVYKYLSASSNLDISKVGYIGNELVGCLLLGNRQIYDRRFSKFKGVEGILFFIKDEYRGTSMHKEFLKNPPKCDYVWAMVYSSLNTHNYWKRVGFKSIDDDAAVVFYYLFLNKEANAEFATNNIDGIRMQYQDTEYNCGTTVASMIIEYIHDKKVNTNVLFDKYCKREHGTTTYNMINILKDHKVDYVHIGKSDIQSYIQNGYIVACLISMRDGNIPHWLLLSDYDETTDEYLAYDPAGGIYYLESEELEYVLEIKPWNGASVETIMSIAGKYQVLAIKK